MRIVCIGGGPAGLYFAISMKLRDPAHEITVHERNRPGDTFGWGVVFSDETMFNLRANDARSAQRILDEFSHWDDVDVHIRGECVTSTGHGFCGIGRKRLLEILQERARELDVELVFESEVGSDLSVFSDADLIIGADGMNSVVRNATPERFDVDIDVRSNKYVWLGTTRPFGAFTFLFEETAQGWIWAHAYRFDAETSTFIVECSEPTWRGLGFDTMTQEESCRACEDIFGEHLDGHELRSNAKHLRGSAWLEFQRILCGKWFDGKVILIGDAAHTAHYSIGSGTKLAFEDAICLADMLRAEGVVETALASYQDVRRLEVLKLQSAARNSTEWFEHVPRYVDLEPIQFAYSLLTRSQRISHENLRLRDEPWLENVERWFAAGAHGADAFERVPPMFTPFRLRELEIMNRIVVSPMSTYSAVEGRPTDFHLVHYGARAQGGCGLLFTEMTDVSADARITPGCAGLYGDEHVVAWKRIVDFVHAESSAKIAIQLGHAGPKGSTRLGWEGADVPLEADNWPILGASAIPWSPENQVPCAMTREDMDRVRADFVRAACMAEACGFDLCELHCAHGYLLSSFITPLMNARDDEYGGSLENRLRYPLEVFRAVRAVWPEHKPMSVRISATDWVGERGVTPVEAVEIARAFVEAGADLIDVSAGQTSVDAEPVYGRMFQTPFSDRIRNELGCATMAVGNIYDVDHVNSILASGRADLCALARPHLLDPFWTLRAAAQQRFTRVPCPPPYLPGRDQLERLLERQAEQGMIQA